MQTKITSVKFQVTGRGVVVVEDDLDKTGNNDLKIVILLDIFQKLFRKFLFQKFLFSLCHRDSIILQKNVKFDKLGRVFFAVMVTTDKMLFHVSGEVNVKSEVVGKLNDGQNERLSHSAFSFWTSLENK